MRADALANRDALLYAARTLMAARGAVVPMSAVAQEAGVGIATLYRHFPTQEDLLHGLAGRLRDQVVGIARRWLPLFETDAEAAWSGFAHDIVGLRLGTLVPQLAELAGIEHAQDDLDAVLAGARSEVIDAVCQVVEAARAAGLVRADADVLHVHVALGTISRPAPTVVTSAVPDLESWMVDVYLRGLRP